MSNPIRLLIVVCCVLAALLLAAGRAAAEQKQSGDPAQVGTTPVTGKDGPLDTAAIDFTPFTTSTQISGVLPEAGAWGDLDNDDDYDVIVTGCSAADCAHFVTRTFRQNNAGAFVSAAVQIPGVRAGDIDLGDYDGDGDPDVLIAGTSESSGPVSRVYRNNGNNQFIIQPIALEGVTNSAVAWGDYDNDGDLDILLAGSASGGNVVAKLYRNSAGSFALHRELPGVTNGAVAWGDYDNDGDLDLAMTGSGPNGAPTTNLLRNDNGNFVAAANPFLKLSVSDLAWGDYDNDGDLDLLLAGRAGAGGSRSAKLYRNDNDAFFDSGIGLTGVSEAHVSWIDYDKDGDRDAFIAGRMNSGFSESVLYRNDNGGLVDSGFRLGFVKNAVAAWADYDGDHAPDLLLAGATDGAYAGAIIRNNQLRFNFSPSVPGGLRFERNGVGQVTLKWNAASDSETAAPGLSYNVRVGTAPGGQTVVPGNANAQSGARRVARDGNAGHNLKLPLVGLDLQTTYYASVQAIDPNYIPSAFSQEISFTLGSFVQAVSGLPNRDEATGRWGDFDRDGDLDLLLMGRSGNVDLTEIYRNNGSSFTLVPNVALPGLRHGTGEWADFDGDGDLDLLLAGGDTPFAQLYRTTVGSALPFEPVRTFVIPVSSAAAVWGDFDNDGDLDLVLSGITTDQHPLTVLHITGINSVNGGDAPLVGGGGTRALFGNLAADDIAAGDYDGDGDLDLAASGCLDLNCTQRRSFLLSNDGDGFRSSQPVDLGIAYQDAYLDWGNCDADGDLDLVIGGREPGSTRSSTQVLLTDGAALRPASPPIRLPGYANGDAAWGDYDNDGDSDLLYGGFAAGDTRLLRNDGCSFSDQFQGLPVMVDGTLAWGDYDNDGRLDFLETGGAGGAVRVFRNTTARAGTPANTPPAAPANVVVQFGLHTTTLSWSAATDAQTISRTLSYNISLHEHSLDSGPDLKPSMSLTSSGRRLLPASGNVGQTTSYTLTNLKPGGFYFVVVQAVDSAFAGGPFSTVIGFRVPTFVAAARLSPGLTNSAAAWGDFDRDGDLDIVRTVGAGGARQTIIERNDGGVFNRTAITNLPGLDLAALAWGDFDNDNDLDLFLSGRDPSNQAIARLFRNNGNSTFTDSGFRFTGIVNGTLAWGDMDNDGDLDLLMAGESGATRVLNLMRNDRTNFASVSAGLPQLIQASAAWGDFDSDGDLDLLLAGCCNGTAPLSAVYRNNGDSTFTDIRAGLVGVVLGKGVWGDLDNDADLDIVLTGRDGAGNSYAKKLLNDRGAFVAPDFDELVGLQRSDASLGDLDNDGDLDLAIGGILSDSNQFLRTDVWGNRNSVFLEFQETLIAVGGPLAWGDKDNDGRLDLLVNSTVDVGNTLVLRNNALRANSPPSAPFGLTVVVNQNARTATLSWEPAFDFETPTRGLTYNLAVGTSLNGFEIMSPMTIGASTGITSSRRLLPAMGNTNHRTSWTIKNLTPGRAYFATVQTVDSAYQSSEFAPTVVFTMPGANNVATPGTQLPARGAVRVGEAVSFVTTCSDPDGWRDVATIDFRLHGGGAGGTTTFWAQFDQNSQLFRLYDPDSDTWSEGTAGENRVLATRYAELRLVGTKAQGRGPTSPFVDITWDVVFKDAAAGFYSQTVQITDDPGETTGEHPVGDWLVLATSRQTFSDVATDDYFFLPAEYLAARGVVSGYGDRSFRPQNGTTRGQMTKMIVLARGWELANPASATFSDVGPLHPFYRYIETAARERVVAGYDDGLFRPENPVTRGQLAKIMVGAMDWSLSKPATASFGDVLPEDPFYTFVETAVEHGIISGYTVEAGREYRPSNGATRGQIAKIIYLAIGQTQ